MDHSRINFNKRASLAILVGIVLVPSALFMAISLATGLGPIPGLVAIVLIIASVTFVYRGLDTRILNGCRAVPAHATTFARVHNLVEGLCVTGGIAQPKLWVIEHSSLNAMSVGRDPLQSHLAFTTGLTNTLSRVELEAVLAHELTHIAYLDTKLNTVACMAPAFVANWMMDRRGGEAFTDAEAVVITRYPPGLAAALDKVENDTSEVVNAPKVARHIWLDPPSFRGHMQDRINALKQL